MKIIKSVIVLILIVGVHACNSDNGINTPGVEEGRLPYETLQNVSYGSDANQVYDIYLPENRTTSTKILIIIHGGGWTAGDKDDDNVTGFINFFREKFPDVALVNINYRLANISTTPFPMQTDDITTVVNDLKAKQTTYQIGTDLGFFGISAGGHLSLLWSYAFDLENNVDMVASFVGPTNLADENYLNSEEEEIQGLITLFGQEVELLQNVSPLFKVSATSPPTVLFYGGEDPLVPITQGVDLDAKLTELNVVHDFNFYPNEGHGWVGESLLHTAVKLEAFINTHLKD